MKLLDVKPFRQSPSHCGPASLKMVMKYYGLERSEKELARLTKCTKAKGTDAKNILSGAKKCGMSGYIKDYSTLKDIRSLLEKDIPVIVDWFSHDEGHYSVVIGLDDKDIYMQDPELGHIRTMRREKFMTVWFDFDGEHIRSQKDVIVKRMIVITPKKR